MVSACAELDLYPSDLLDRCAEQEDQDLRWWALYTRSRQEKRMMRQLYAMNVSFYSPLVPRCSQSSSGRVRTAHVPLFAGYVFIHGDESSRFRALTTNCVSRTISVPDGLELKRDLSQVRRLIQSGLPLSAESRLQPGTRVRVCGGPMDGQEGRIIERRGQTHLLVAINFLQQGASVLLNGVHVEPLS